MSPATVKRSFDFLGIVANVVNEVWLQSTALSVILTVADSILGSATDTSDTFTNNSTSGMLKDTIAYKMKFPSNYFIEKGNYSDNSLSAERFEFIAEMATKESEQLSAYWTYAVADFTFRLGWADITGQSGSKIYTDYKELGYYNNNND